MRERNNDRLDWVVNTLLGLAVMASALVMLHLVSSGHAHAQKGKSFHVQWQNPAFRENGTDFGSGEFLGTQITYFKNDRIYTEFVSGRPAEDQAFQVTVPSGGWWNVYLEAISDCLTVNGAAIGDGKCYSNETATLTVRAR